MEDGLKLSKLSVNLMVLFLFSSCAWLDSMERGLTGEDNKEYKKAKKLVPKAEYDELLSRYEELNRQYQALKEGRASDPLVSDLKQSPMITNKGIDNGPRVETVDVFATKSSQLVDLGSVESQLMKYRKAQALEAQSASEAMKIFQELAVAAASPIRARSQLKVGEILMNQGEHDLALQAFELVITKMANSGAVIEALRHAATCSEKLGLTQKKDQYTSLLRDVFQVGA
jgi:tetratricopeptide (TPR) repeat protein